MSDGASACSNNAVTAGVSATACIGGVVATIATLEVPPAAIGAGIATAGACFGTGWFGAETVDTCSDNSSSAGTQNPGDTVESAPPDDWRQHVVIEPLPDSASYDDPDAVDSNQGSNDDNVGVDGY